MVLKISVTIGSTQIWINLHAVTYQLCVLRKVNILSLRFRFFILKMMIAMLSSQPGYQNQLCHQVANNRLRKVILSALPLQNGILSTHLIFPLLHHTNHIIQLLCMENPKQCTFQGETVQYRTENTIYMLQVILIFHVNLKKNTRHCAESAKTTTSINLYGPIMKHFIGIIHLDLFLLVNMVGQYFLHCMIQFNNQLKINKANVSIVSSSTDFM